MKVDKSTDAWQAMTEAEKDHYQKCEEELENQLRLLLNQGYDLPMVLRALDEVLNEKATRLIKDGESQSIKSAGYWKRPLTFIRGALEELKKPL